MLLWLVFATLLALGHGQMISSAAQPSAVDQQPMFGMLRPNIFQRMTQSLPVTTQQQLQAIRDNQALNWKQRRGQMWRVFDQLPVEQRPVPRFIQRLSPELQGQFMSILRNPSMTFRQRGREMHRLYQALPANQKPPPFVPRFINRLPEPLKSQLMGVYQNPSLNFRQKFQQAKSMFSSASPEVQQVLPPWIRGQMPMAPVQQTAFQTQQFSPSVSNGAGAPF